MVEGTNEGKGRAIGDAAAMVQGETEMTYGGGVALTTGAETFGVGAAAGGVLALHGLGVGAAGRADLIIVTAKLGRLAIVSRSSADVVSQVQKVEPPKYEPPKIPEGFKKVKEFGQSHGQDIYKKGKQYFSRDIDSHNGGIWKVFKKVGKRQMRLVRGSRTKARSSWDTNQGEAFII